MGGVTDLDQKFGGDGTNETDEADGRTYARTHVLSSPCSVLGAEYDAAKGGRPAHGSEYAIARIHGRGIRRAALCWVSEHIHRIDTGDAR